MIRKRAEKDTKETTRQPAGLCGGIKVLAAGGEPKDRGGGTTPPGTDAAALIRTAREQQAPILPAEYKCPKTVGGAHPF